MNNIYLDCTGLPRSISLNKGDLPNSIYIDGSEFIQRLSTEIDRLVLLPEKTKEQKRWELILALAGNPAMIITRAGSASKGEDYYLDDDELSDNASQLISQADAIIKQLEAEKN